MPSGAVAQSPMCSEPVPDPVAAGWTEEGTQPAQSRQHPLILNDGSTAPGEFISFSCPVDGAVLATEVVLRPRVSIDPGFNAASGNTAVHVTIGDGSREIRAVLLAEGPGALRVAIDLGGDGFSQGLTFDGLTADFTLKRMPSGNAVLALPTGETEEVDRFSLPSGNRKALEFGTQGPITSSSVSRWERVVTPAPAVCRNTPSAILPPVRADGSSRIPLGLPVLVAIRVTDCNGAIVDTLVPELALEKLDPDPQQVTQLLSTLSGPGTTLRFLAGHYAYLLSTNQTRLASGQRLTAGRYRLTIADPSFTAPVTAEFTLRS